MDGDRLRQVDLGIAGARPLIALMMWGLLYLLAP